MELQEVRKDGNQQREMRGISAVDLRIEERSDGALPKIGGYAAKFNMESQLLGGSFTESIRSGAFKRSLENGADVRALIDHNPSLIVGRNTAGTMTVVEDETGLLVEVTPVDTTIARDLIANIRAGNISQMSFAFQVLPDGDEWQIRDGAYHRVLTAVELFDVSFVTYPAYTQTDAWLNSVRSVYARGQEIVPMPAEPKKEETIAELREALKMREDCIEG